MKRFSFTFILLHCFCLIIIFNSFSQASITGTITDINGAPVSHAHVQFAIEAEPFTEFSTTTDSNGSYEMTFETSVDEPADTRTEPENFSLQQNYPNPFNPSTVISFTLENTGQVKLTVYNVLGQKVRILFNGYQTAGLYSLMWNGYDDHGVSVGAGMYIYRLEYEGRSLSKKMLLLDGGAVRLATGTSNNIFSGSATAKSTVHHSEMALHHFTFPENTTIRITISGENVFPLIQTGVTVADGQVVDFEVSPLSSRASGTLSASTGGSVELDDGARVIVHDNTLNKTKELSLSSTDRLPPALSNISMTQAGNVYHVDTHGAELMKTAELSLPFDTSLLGDDMTEEDIFAAYWDGSNWFKAQGQTDTELDTIKVDTLLHGIWSVFYGQLIEDVTVHKASVIIEENIDNPFFVLIDVRTPGEYATHIPGAININSGSGTFGEELDKLDREALYLVYCHSGGRSARAVQVMEEMGFQVVYNMLGGISTWISYGYATVE